MTDKKLLSLLHKLQREIAVTAFHVRSGQNKNTAKISKTKKTIARILTLLAEKKISISPKK